MRRTTLGIVLLVGIWWWRREAPGSAPMEPSNPQAGVLANGFTMLSGPPATRYVRELDRENRVRHEMMLPLDREVRIVGEGRRTAVAWLADSKVKLATLERDGNLREVSTWGKRAQRLCEGAASNQHRFGVGWLEGDGTIWFVHGPMRGGADVDADLTVERASDEADLTVERASDEAEPAKITWCGIAAAEQNIALLWRDGSRVLMNFCTPKKCTRLVVKLPLDRRDTLLGFGCVRDHCVFATRDRDGNAKATCVTEKGKGRSTVIGEVPAGSQMTAVGVGRGAFAIAFANDSGTTIVEQLSLTCERQRQWRVVDAQGTPALAWADGKLFLGFPDGGHVTLDMPQ